MNSIAIKKGALCDKLLVSGYVANGCYQKRERE